MNTFSLILLPSLLPLSSGGRWTLLAAAPGRLLDPARDEFRARRVHLHLREQGAEGMILDGVDAHVQILGNLPVLEAQRDTLEHVDLPWREDLRQVGEPIDAFRLKKREVPGTPRKTARTGHDPTRPAASDIEDGARPASVAHDPTKVLG